MISAKYEDIVVVLVAVATAARSYSQEMRKSLGISEREEETRI